MFATRYPFRSFLTSPFLTCSNSLATAPSSKQSTNAQWFIPVTIPCFPIPSLSWKPFLCPFFVLPAMNSRHCAYTLHCSFCSCFSRKRAEKMTHTSTHTHTHTNTRTQPYRRTMMRDNFFCQKLPTLRVTYQNSEYEKCRN